MTANVARTASRALSDAIRKPLGEVADTGLPVALRNQPGLRAGVYLYRGTVANPSLATSHGLPGAEITNLLADA